MCNQLIILSLFMSSQLPLMAQKKVLLLIAGQSNAVGHGNKDSSVKLPAGIAYEYKYSTNALQPLLDPVGEDTLHFHKAASGSMGPAFAKQLYEQKGFHAVIVSAARGGSSCSVKAELDNYGTWDTAGHLPLFDNAVLKTKNAMATTGLPLQGIIWLQGERDANAINNHQLTGDEYAATLEQLIIRFRQALGTTCAFYIVQTGYYTGFPTAGFDAVRKAQEEVCKRLKAVYLAYSQTNNFKEKGWMTDAIHYNQQGLDDIGKEVANLVVRRMK
jgi:hypothetical protein